MLQPFKVAAKHRCYSLVQNQVLFFFSSVPHSFLGSFVITCNEYSVLSLHTQNPTVEYMNSIYNPVPWEKDEYLKPVLEDDLLLQFGKVNLLYLL